jgi:hypothetical protein
MLLPVWLALGPLAVLRCAGSGSWDRKTWEIDHRWLMSRRGDSCRRACVFRATVDLMSRVDAGVRGRKETREYISMPNLTSGNPIASSSIEALARLVLADPSGTSNAGYVCPSRGHGVCRGFGVGLPISSVGSNPKQWYGQRVTRLSPKSTRSSIYNVGKCWVNNSDGSQSAIYCLARLAK